jgi:hypothetical protein
MVQEVSLLVWTFVAGIGVAITILLAAAAITILLAAAALTPLSHMCHILIW